MDESFEIKELYRVADNASNKLVSCNGCTKCCQSGIAYVLPKEINRLESLGVPLLHIDGINYIKRNYAGACSMLDMQHSRCSIYEDRPLCCRLFPLDVFGREPEGGRKIKPSWGIYNYCPPENVKPIIIRNNRPELDLDVLSIMANSIEKFIPKKVLNFLVQEDRITAQIEILDSHREDFIIVDEVTNI